MTGSAPTVNTTPVLDAASGPHLAGARTTHTAMLDVLVALAPVVAVAVWFFGMHALVQIGLATAACLAAEAGCAWLRGRRAPWADCSAVITGVILGLSLPWSAPWYVALIGGTVGISLGKAIYGGLGQNLFNPAMVGRAFVMIAFSLALGSGAFVDPTAVEPILTQATPLAMAKTGAAASDMPGLWLLFIGAHNGSLGEVSVLAVLLGGAWLCLRRTADWRVPVGMIGSVAVLAGLGHLLAGPQALKQLPVLGSGVLVQLCSGSLVFGAFFIATDPVTNPLTPQGRWIFAIGCGVLVWVIRTFSGYPEGVMFAVLLMNGLTPLINRWSIPTPVGGVPPAAKA